MKMTDCLGENSETLVWLDLAIDCKYISETEYNKGIEINAEVGKLLSYMMANPEKFGVAPL
jgi:four helix bundle protein